MEKASILLATCFAIMACLCGVHAVCDAGMTGEPVDQAFIANPLAAWKNIFYYIIRSRGTDVCVETRTYNSVTGNLVMIAKPQPISNIFHQIQEGKIVNYKIDFTITKMTFILFNDAATPVTKSCTWAAKNNFNCVDTIVDSIPSSRAHSTWNTNGQIVSYSTVPTNPADPSDSPATKLRLKWPQDTLVRNALPIAPAATGTSTVSFLTVTSLLQVDPSTIIALGKDGDGSPVSGRIKINTAAPNNEVTGYYWVGPPAAGYSMLV